MSEPKRYDLITTVSAGRLSQTDLVESKDGSLVRWNDYARLKADVERLRRLGTEMGKHLPDTDAANKAYIDFEMGGKP